MSKTSQDETSPADKDDETSKYLPNQVVCNKSQQIEKIDFYIVSQSVEEAAAGPNLSDVANPESDQGEEKDADKDAKKKKNRCATCRKKVGLTGMSQVVKMKRKFLIIIIFFYQGLNVVAGAFSVLSIDTAISTTVVSTIEKWGPKRSDVTIRQSSVKKSRKYEPRHSVPCTTTRLKSDRTLDIAGVVEISAKSD